MLGTCTENRISLARLSIPILAAGVPCVPGYHGTNQDPNRLFFEAEKIGRFIFMHSNATDQSYVMVTCVQDILS